MAKKKKAKKKTAKKKTAKKKTAKKKTAKKKTTKKKPAKKKAPKGLWTKAEENLLKKLFSTNPTSKIAAKLGRKTDAVKKKAGRMKLRKSKKYLKSIGRK